MRYAAETQTTITSHEPAFEKPNHCVVGEGAFAAGGEAESWERFDFCL